MLGAGFEPPFTHPPVTDIERKDAALRVALEWIESNPEPRRLGAFDAITTIKEALQ
jgi:hypothetical protein